MHLGPAAARPAFSGARAVREVGQVVGHGYGEELAWPASAAVVAGLKCLYQ